MRVFLAMILVCCLARIGAKAAGGNRHNLFDPLYAFDDVDAHTVTAGSGNQLDSFQSPRAGLARNFHRPTLVEADDGEQLKTAGETGGSQSTARSDRPTVLVTNPAQVASQHDQMRNNSRRQIVSTVAAATTNEQPQAKRADEQPHHWSALENYYQKLRESAINNQLRGQAFDLQQYAILNEPELVNPRPIYSGTKLSARQPGHVLLAQVRPADLAHSQPFLLPLNNEPANVEPAFGSGQLAPSSRRPPYSSHSSPSQADLLLNYNPIGTRDMVPDIERQQQIAYYQAERASGSPASQQQAQAGHHLGLLASLLDSGRMRQLEWRKLPELLLIEQQQKRAKHQQDTFGSWYDYQRSRELLQEEAFCGPRNYVNLRLAPAAAASLQARLNASVPTKGQTPVSPSELARLSYSDLNELANQADVAATLTPGEYPSHMGVYNGTPPNEDNFLCSATYVHERFALTLASCLVRQGFINQTRLFVRSNEWNLNSPNTNSTNEFQQRSMLTHQVRKIHVFPKYLNGSSEHDLALLEFDQPIDYLLMPYICPACQTQSRSSIRAHSCWAPVRNVTLSEYFDADGEGETRLKRTVNMRELPIKLIANDEVKCKEQTYKEFFNFNHPNYICSADFRLAKWRANLNQTDYFGSGIYCNEGGILSLISIVHPIHQNTPSAQGYMDLSYYRPWIRNVILGRSY